MELFFCCKSLLCIFRASSVCFPTSKQQQGVPRKTFINYVMGGGGCLCNICSCCNDYCCYYSYMIICLYSVCHARVNRKWFEANVALTSDLCAPPPHFGVMNLMREQVRFPTVLAFTVKQYQGCCIIANPLQSCYLCCYQPKFPFHCLVCDCYDKLWSSLRL